MWGEELVLLINNNSAQCNTFNCNSFLPLQSPPPHHNLLLNSRDRPAALTQQAQQAKKRLLLQINAIESTELMFYSNYSPWSLLETLEWTDSTRWRKYYFAIPQSCQVVLARFFYCNQQEFYSVQTFPLPSNSRHIRLILSIHQSVIVYLEWRRPWNSQQPQQWDNNTLVDLFWINFNSKQNVNSSSRSSSR